MNAKDICFGSELGTNFRPKGEIPITMEGKLVNVTIIDDDRLAMKFKDNTYVLELVSKNNFEFMERIKKLNNRILARVEDVKTENVFLTTFLFANQVTFEDSEQLEIVIDDAIRDDLKKVKEKYKNFDLIKFISEQFILDDYVFANDSKNKEDLRLIGKDYFCQVRKTPQNYYHVYKLNQRKRNNVINNRVSLLKGNIKFSDRLSNTSIIKRDIQKKFELSIKSTEDILKHWEIYNDLELEVAKEEALDLGYIRYESFNLKPHEDYDDKLVIEFISNNEIPSQFYSSTSGLAISSEKINGEDDTFKYPKESTYIGFQTTIDGNKIQITVDEEFEVTIPSKGYILHAYTGSKKMVERRIASLNKIRNHNTALLELATILQSGEGKDTRERHKRSMSSEALRKVFGDKKINFTETQKNAIDIAINTPDIAIIQGPPGTGKTSVIKAIVAQLEILYNDNVNILISSTQHDAVDNVINGMNSGAMPVKRVGKKTGSSNINVDIQLYNWMDNMISNCEDYIEKQGTDHRSSYRKLLLYIKECKTILSTKDIIIKENREDLKTVLYNIYKILMSENINEDIINRFNKINEKINTIGCVNKNLNNGSNDKVIDRLKLLIDGQRLNEVSFNDDGLVQLSRLLNHIDRFNIKDINIPEYWRTDTYWEDEKLAEKLDVFATKLEEIKNNLGIEEVKEYSKLELNLDLEYIFLEIENKFMTANKNNKDSLISIVSEFKEHLESPSNIRSIISKYTKVYAATCQQSISREIKTNSKDIIYDYVIIDESARSNPLDLIIPMCLGKKIILVGDQKQLPHMLEKDVLEKFKNKLIKENKEDVDSIIQLLETSLFERLFGLLQKNKIIVRTETLKEQYRMHHKIGDFVSECFYKEELESPLKGTEKDHNLNMYSNKPVAWIDIPIHKGMETRDVSKYREVEVKALMDELLTILNKNDEYTVGVITFYKKQAELLQDRVSKLFESQQKRVEIGTIDSFQGKEFDVVLMSCSRSNKNSELTKRVGFLNSKNRLCVAFSRAKRLLVVIGDAQTVASDGKRIYIEELHKFLKLCKKEGYYEYRN